MYKLITMQGRARRGTFTTVHGKIEMPAFMKSLQLVFQYTS